MRVSEFKKLRMCTYQNTHESTWVGYTDGIVHEGLYLRVYAADYRTKKYYWKKTNYINVPLSRVFSF